MADEFLSFRSFESKEQAEPLLKQLDDAFIPYIVEDNGGPLPGFFIGQYRERNIEVCIVKSDFLRANQLLEANAHKQDIRFPADYYLYSFTDNELKEVVQNKKEWNEIDRALAEKILKEKGIEFTEADKIEIEQEYVKQISTVQKATWSIILTAYVIIILGLFFLPIVTPFGFGIGLYLWLGRRTLPDGNKVFSYEKVSRLHGMIVFIGGMLLYIGLIACNIISPVDYPIFNHSMPNIELP